MMPPNSTPSGLHLGLSPYISLSRPWLTLSRG